jgi:hypothetical protein
MKDLIDSLDLIIPPYTETSDNITKAFAPGKKSSADYSLQPPAHLHRSFGLVFTKVMKDGNKP